jgi:acyl-[acyl-carrier-protein]-phospholipid O-acyltransferase/long-chain-fatty-acid--[acyl-carrier-protein] ligase
MEKAGLGKVEVMNSDSPLSLRTLAQALEDGRSVAIFPEGRITRPDEVVQLKPGVGWLAKKTGATVVQAELIGAENSRWFSPAGSILWPKITLLF